MSFNIDFKGYRLDKNINTLTNSSGIYVVYRCIYDSVSDTVDIKELLYIGQAENLRERLMSHEKKPLFFSSCMDGETICYSYATVNKSILNEVENGLIFMQQPKLNERLKDHYNYYVPVLFEITGRCDKFRMKLFNIIEKP